MRAKKIALAVVGAFNRVSERLAFMPFLVAMGVAACMCEMAQAQSVDLIPESPVDMVEFIGEANGRLGLIVGAIVGVWFVYMLVRKGLKWSNKIG